MQEALRDMACQDSSRDDQSIDDLQDLGISGTPKREACQGLTDLLQAMEAHEVEAVSEVDLSRIGPDRGVMRTCSWRHHRSCGGAGGWQGWSRRRWADDVRAMTFRWFRNSHRGVGLGSTHMR